jgi:hypothetical protein
VNRNKSLPLAAFVARLVAIAPSVGFAAEKAQDPPQPPEGFKGKIELDIRDYAHLPHAAGRARSSGGQVYLVREQREPQRLVVEGGGGVTGRGARAEVVHRCGSRDGGEVRCRR